MHKSYNDVVFTNKDLKIMSFPKIVSSVDSINNFSNVYHEDIEIKLFYEGSSTLLIDDKNFETLPGDVVIINPYEFHSTVNLGQEKGKYHLLMVGLDFFDGTYSNLLDLRNIFLKERICIKNLIRGNIRISDIVNNIVCELNEKREMYENVVQGLVLELFSILIRDYKSNDTLDLPSDKNIRYYEIIYPAIRKIRKDFASNISIDELAAMCNVSKYHFCRIFKAVTSFSAVNYQTEYRLRIADILLKNSDKSISEIADMCGFGDAGYFSRCYKKHTGVSPREKRIILSK